MEKYFEELAKEHEEAVKVDDYLYDRELYAELWDIYQGDFGGW